MAIPSSCSPGRQANDRSPDRRGCARIGRPPEACPEVRPRVSGIPPGLIEGKTVRLAYEPAGARLDKYGRRWPTCTWSRAGRSSTARSSPRDLGSPTQIPVRLTWTTSAKRSGRRGRRGLGSGDPIRLRKSHGRDDRLRHEDRDEVSSRRLSGAGQERDGDPPGRSPGDTRRARCAIRRSYRDTRSGLRSRIDPSVFGHRMVVSTLQVVRILARRRQNQPESLGHSSIPPVDLGEWRTCRPPFPCRQKPA